MDNFKASQMALKQVLAASKRNDFDAIVPLANQIKNWANNAMGIPSGSDGLCTEAAQPSGQTLRSSKSAAEKTLKQPVFGGYCLTAIQQRQSYQTTGRNLQIVSSKLSLN